MCLGMPLFVTTAREETCRAGETLVDAIVTHGLFLALWNRQGGLGGRGIVDGGGGGAQGARGGE